MLVAKEYNRRNALTYARRWALDRNPLYFNYTGMGGNCTNFVSQCVYAGGCTMNYTPVFGWYYLSPSERTASWTGVTFFYNFLTGNTGVGPFGREVGREELLPGDVIQLGREEGGFYHSLLVLEKTEEDYFVAAQSDDALDRPLSTYSYDYARYLHIDGIRISVPDTGDCFASLLAGTAILPDLSAAPPLPPLPDEMPGETEEEETPPASEELPQPVPDMPEDSRLRPPAAGETGGGTGTGEAPPAGQ